jgi:hypothetical protein
VYAVRSLLAGRWIVVLVCYLDDSGKDPQNRITMVAGYIAKDDQWEAFEVAVELWFTERGVEKNCRPEAHGHALYLLL